jgi:hypothetical protein
MLTEEQKQAIRTKVLADTEKLVDGLAPLYLGRICPLKRTTEGDRECDGPRCMLYAPLNDNPDSPHAVTGGACSLALGVSQLVQLNGAVQHIAAATTPARVIQP